jgi:hypothetical protein
MKALMVMYAVAILLALLPAGWYYPWGQPMTVRIGLLMLPVVLYAAWHECSEYMRREK